VNEENDPHEALYCFNSKRLNSIFGLVITEIEGLFFGRRVEYV